MLAKYTHTQNFILKKMQISNKILANLPSLLDKWRYRFSHGVLSAIWTAVCTNYRNLSPAWIGRKYEKNLIMMFCADKCWQTTCKSDMYKTASTTDRHTHTHRLNSYRYSKWNKSSIYTLWNGMYCIIIVSTFVWWTHSFF